MRQWTRDTDKSSPYYWRTRMEAMRRMLITLNPDVICFQEFLAPVGKYVPDCYKRVGLSVSHPIYIRKGMTAKKHKFSVFWEACTIDSIRIFNVHTRWERNILDCTVKDLNGMLTGRDIACGDFNNPLYTIKASGLKMYSAKEILKVPEEDTFQNFAHPESYGAIDHFFVNNVEPWRYEMVTCGYGVARMSDHWPIMLTI